MLAGEAVVAIWNDIAPEARTQFYDWHTNEHMPERVGIPGFRRGRRAIALDEATQPEFFTLYEADTFEVITGSDYVARLNDPTPATRTVTAQFRATTRTLARVVESRGPGLGGILLTLRFEAEAMLVPELSTITRSCAVVPRVTGAHLCRTERDASDLRTAETRARADIETPPAWFALPAWFVLIEATDPEAIDLLAVQQAMSSAGAHGPFVGGRYRLEYLRTRTAVTP